MSFTFCLQVILKSEGGYTEDQGGPTNLGVTQATLSDWLKREATVDEVKALTPGAVAPLYQALYYNAAHCNELPAGLDLMVFDEAVNEGVGRAVKHLQEAVKVEPDGIFGPATLSAVAAMEVPAAINAIHTVNTAYYQSLASEYPEDLFGWLARNDRTRAIALSWVN